MADTEVSFTLQFSPEKTICEVEENIEVAESVENCDDPQVMDGDIYEEFTVSLPSNQAHNNRRDKNDLDQSHPIYADRLKRDPSEKSGSLSLNNDVPATNDSNDSPGMISSVDIWSQPVNLHQSAMERGSEVDNKAELMSASGPRTCRQAAGDYSLGGEGQLPQGNHLQARHYQKQQTLPRWPVNYQQDKLMATGDVWQEEQHLAGCGLQESASWEDLNQEMCWELTGITPEEAEATGISLDGEPLEGYTGDIGDLQEEEEYEEEVVLATEEEYDDSSSSDEDTISEGSTTTQIYIPDYNSSQQVQL